MVNPSLPDVDSLDPALLDQIPAMKPPDGLSSNFVNPPSISYVVLITVGITLPLMLAFLVLRIYTRIKIAREYSPDDYLCIAGAVRPILDHVAEESVALSSLFAAGAVLVKTTLLAFYLRLFRPILRAKIMAWAGIVAITLFYGSYVIAYLVLCVPGLSTLPQCAKFTGQISLAHGIFSTITDFYILYIPLQMIPTLQLSKKRKLSVSTVFATGLLACAASISGVVFRVQMSQSTDFTWLSVPVYATVVAELNIGTICSCMPVVFVLFKNFSKAVGTKWTSLFRSQGTDSKGKTYKLEELASLPRNGAEDGSLPPAPYPTLTGVKTFVHQVQYTTPHSNANPFRSTNPYSEIQDDDSDNVRMENLRLYEVEITANNNCDHGSSISTEELRPRY
ncbi:hypothetical protein O1611_g506 [Lasiodiplodia mahajangana]|uniref:Uncharacterized protein n=1 Tax=Lasiodiplodia mahajangana TaxID=1108764 RepID=A0ACC2K106_9PEZI|nr:hypothetical protein O1611_g506 [Lasiodiplodia mahajangana]